MRECNRCVDTCGSRHLDSAPYTVCYLCEETDQTWPRLKHLNFIRISGPTGSGKSAVLESLEERGEQVLHLEHLARHKGGVETVRESWT